MRLLGCVVYLVLVAAVGCAADEKEPLHTSETGVIEGSPVLRDYGKYDSQILELIAQMTVEEKISQLGSNAPAIERLGIPAYYYWNESHHGVKQNFYEYEAFRATSFPTGIAMGSTWDPELVQRIASAISDEARVISRHTGKGLTFYAPMINELRDPRWGRFEEGFSEDVALTSAMGVAYVRGLQGDDPNYFKAIATAKHYLANNSEFNRFYGSSDFDERTLREYYLPAFEAAINEGGAFSIMPAYNAVNGTPAVANDYLLGDILRLEWQFPGFVVSDCDGVSRLWSDHAYTETLEESAALALIAGTDMDCSIPDVSAFQASLLGAYEQGWVDIDMIDVALMRILRARFFLGDFDPDGAPFQSIPDGVLESWDHRVLAHDAAQKSIVLLKNDGILPLDPRTIGNIALIGPNAGRVVLGLYSGIPTYHVNAYEGLLEALRSWYTPDQFAETAGVEVDNGKITRTTHGAWIAYDLDFGEKVGFREFTVRAAGEAGGYIDIHLDAVDGPSVARCEVPPSDGNGWDNVSCGMAELSGVHRVYFVFSGPADENLMKVDTYAVGLPLHYAEGCSVGGDKDQAAFDNAVAVARETDVVIYVGGTDLDVLREDYDRENIDLPGVQGELIQALVQANPRTVVVLATAGPLDVRWAQEHAPAILSTWYNGQEQGGALANVLLGRFNPGGKLSTTWFQSADDLPPIDDYGIRNGRTYMYFRGTPLYPFGHGLSYTTFAYENLHIERGGLDGSGEGRVSVDVVNTGSVVGDEVAQLYIHARDAAVDRPIQQLRGFRRITLEPGQRETVTFRLTRRDIAYWDEAGAQWRVEPGTIDVLVGSSSADIRLTGTLQIRSGGGFVQLPQ